MKRTTRILGLCLVSVGVLPPVSSAAQSVSATALVDVPPVRVGNSVEIGVFDDALSPYGEWISVANYGRVWRPSAAVVGVGFRPYATGGHWVATDYGWSFETDWPWGWAAFHYGRWALDPIYGWVWVPDSVWGPAWVDWRFGGGYVGWAPLAPGYGGVTVEAPGPSWCFVETTHFTRPYVHEYLLPFPRARVAFGATGVVRNPVVYGGVRFNAGPRFEHIAQASRTPIVPVRIAPPVPGRVAPVRVGGPPAAGYHGGYLGGYRGGYHGGYAAPAATSRPTPPAQMSQRYPVVATPRPGSPPVVQPRTVMQPQPRAVRTFGTYGPVASPHPIASAPRPVMAPQRAVAPRPMAGPRPVAAPQAPAPRGNFDHRRRW